MRAVRPCLALVATSLLAACPRDDGPQSPPPPVTATGQGTVRSGGVDAPYIVDGESRLLILVKTRNSAGCRLFHNHAIAATQLDFAFAMDRDNPAASTFTATVVANGLDADRDAYRAVFDETRDSTFSEKDRGDVRISALAHLRANTFPTLVFTASGLSTLEGAGTGTLVATIKGVDQTLPFNGTATWTGAQLELSGRVDLPGGPHTIPEPSEVASSCVDPLMTLDFHLVLKPGEKPDASALPLDAGAPWTPTFFPADAGCGPAGFDTVRDVLVRRCSGCHAELAPYGMLTPLETWTDFRVDGPRAPGIPLYVESLLRMTAPRTEGEVNDAGLSHLQHMPPLADGDPVPDDELARVRAWVEGGGLEATCGRDAGFDLPDASLPTAPECGVVGYAEVARIITRHGCVDCHYTQVDGGPAPYVVPLDTFESGLQPTVHPYYAGLNLWQTSVARMVDTTMPPGDYVDTNAEENALLQAWLADGMPRATCAPADAGPGAPSITMVEPSAAFPGQEVAIRGSGFSTSPSVTFAGTAATPSSSSDTEILVTVPVGAVTGDLVVTNAMGQSASTPFTVLSASTVPVLQAVTPSELLVGSTGNTLDITVTGTTSGAEVRVDGTALTGVTTTATGFRAPVPASITATTGLRLVTVFNPPPGGGESNALPLQVVNPLPTLSSVSPTEILVGAMSAMLTVTGTGFLPGITTATLNGVPAMVSVSSSTSLQVAVPAALAASPGALSLAVSNPFPRAAGSLPAPLTVDVRNPSATLSGVMPSTVTAGGSASTELVLSGTGFVATSVVELAPSSTGPWSALPTTFTSATELRATLSAANTPVGGTLHLSVSSPGASRSGVLPLVLNNPVPTATTLSPSVVAQGGAAFTLTITGTGFNASTVVTDAASSTVLARVSGTATEMQVTVPQSLLVSMGTRTIRVSNPAPGGGQSDLALTVQAVTGPFIQSVSPSPGPRNTPFTVDIRGTNFICQNPPTQRSALFVDGASVTTTCVSASQLTANIAAINNASITLQVRNGMAAQGNTVTLDLVAPNGVPVVSSVSPATLPEGSAATSITVNGSGFVTGSVVTVDGTAVASRFVSSSRVDADLTAELLANAAMLTVRVVNPAPGGGTSTTSATLSVTGGNPAPSVTGLFPPGAAVGESIATLRVLGTGFVSASTVRVGGTPRTTTFISDTELQTSLTATDTMVEGTLLVDVLTPAPGGGTSSPFAFAVTSGNPQPFITALEPASATAGSSGLALVVVGAGLGTYSTVELSGRALATTYSASTPDRVTAQLSSADLASPGAYPVHVVNAGPGGGTSGTLTFTVAASAPTVTSISPSSVPLGSTSTVTVTGSNFTAGSRATVDGTARNSSVLSATQLAFQLDAADTASTGMRTIRVDTGGVVSTTSAQLTVTTASNPVPTVTGVSPGGALAGTAVTLTLTGTGFVTGTEVRMGTTALNVTVMSATQLTAQGTVPAAPPERRLPITVSNPAPGGGQASQRWFGVAATNPSFATLLQQQVFTPSCASGAGCHASGGKAPVLAAGASYNALVGGAGVVMSNGCSPAPYVTRFNPGRAESVLVDKVVANMQSPACFGSPMPKTGSISTAHQDAIRDWIALGAQNN